MRVTRARRAGDRRPVRPRTAATRKSASKVAVKTKVGGRLAHPAPELVLFRLCKPGWAVTVEKIPTALGTRFVCPFCPVSHRVPGPVRGFRKMRRAQWVKLRRVHE